ncbi:uncharacterized protein N7473_009709 [Penicillium subrubescens]|uniref:Dihydrolipoyllysine-residue acetyltransferase component of acetoin cleaving system n=1 Tax=Penicillium subrubescens TaxID=1316194 RepID=A0A1Q5THG6_9EURO|nr:uncharacterized protein N7473_009709 [Penicillium subrubescens]KAJ5887035.1 hypothetical protein N7473_009709 [Penicillium subrubescens]OKO99670.1 Dihydrolipoyllysine-residue acetyltransferase component of acetoin cleaving system [Penicillium subrubescens]
MVNTKTIRVSHLGGIDVAYQVPREYDPAKPTVVLINAFTTSSELYRDQFNDASLTDKMNLVAIELLGHGQTRTAREHWTYWDTAEMNLQVLDALKIDRAFVLGTSQGGWVTVQMALLRPEKILGIIPMGTSMDCESERTRQLDCWNGPAIVSRFLKQWASSEATPNFEPDDVYCDAVIGIGLNQVTPEVHEFWRKTIKSNYQGDEGRRRIRMAAINLGERGALHFRLSDIQCPVLWLHGTKDAVYTIANAREEIQLFTRSPSATLVPVEGGAHFLNASHPREVNAALLDFVNQHK